MSQEPADLYSILGISERASTAEVEAAFAALHAQALAGGVDLEHDEGWSRVQYAHEVLSNPQRRSFYDSLRAEQAGPALRMEVMLSAEKLGLLEVPQLIYALVRLRPNSSEPKAQRPLNLSLVIDRSTSMKGERLEMVVAAVGLIIDKLGPSDMLSVVTFSDRAEVVLPSGSGGKATRTGDEPVPAWRNPHETLRSIVASGGTEMFYGLAAGMGQLKRVRLRDYISHLILLTDGHTYGDAPDCIRLAEEAAMQGVGLSAFGIGADWNDEFLDALVAPSGGHSGHIKEPADLVRLLERRLKGLGAVYARDVRLQTNWPRDVHLQDAFKLTPYAQPLAIEGPEIRLGDVEGRAPLTFLLEFRLAPQSIPTRLSLTFAIQFTAGDAAQGQKTGDILSQRVQLVILDGVDVKAARPPTDLIEAVRSLNLYRLQEQAWDEAQSGQLETAATHMRQLTTRYLEAGELRLAQQADREAQRLTRMGTMSLEGRKILKYGTRALLGQEEP